MTTSSLPRRLVHLAVREALYPGLLVASAAAAHALWGRASDAAVVGGIAAACGLLLLLLERVFPFTPRWAVGLGERAARTDALHTASTALVSVAVDSALLAALTTTAAALAVALGSPLWPSAWPIAAQVVLALLVGEVGSYAVHRACHESALLWRIHAMHHSAERLHLLAAGRNHPFQVVLTLAFKSGPVVLLGAGPEVIALQGLLTAVNGYFQHANLDVRGRWLSWLLATPDLHRWHHSADPAVSRSNYGNTLVVLDVLLGTRHAPRGERPSPDVGVRTPGGQPVPFPEGFLGQLATPFLYGRWEASAEAPR